MEERQNKNSFLINLMISTILLFVGIVFGGLNRILMSGGWIHLTHQGLVGLGGLGMLWAGIQARQARKQSPLTWRLLALGLAAVVVQVVLGQLLANFAGGGWVAGLHFSLSLVVLGAVTAATVYTFALQHSDEDVSLTYQSAFSRQAVLAVVLTLLVLVTGVVVAGSSARMACQGWPLCNGNLFPTTLAGWVVVVHRFAVAAIGLFLLWFNLRAWRTQRGQRCHPHPVKYVGGAVLRPGVCRCAQSHAHFPAAYACPA